MNTDKSKDRNVDKNQEIILLSPFSSVFICVYLWLKISHFRK